MQSKRDFVGIADVRSDGGPSAVMERLVAEKDWSSTALGPIENWPEPLKHCVQVIMASGFPMAVRWGPEMHMIYNDGYAAILADKHPSALGRPTREVWPEIFDDLAPLNRSILRGERNGFFAKDRPWRVRRRGSVPEDVYFTMSYSPIFDPEADKGIGGVLIIAIETTAEVDRAQRLRELNERLEQEVTERTAERDRIWQVSEDLLGVSNFEGYFPSVNPAWTKTLGWSAAEIHRMHVSELRHPEDAPAAEVERRRLAEGVPTVRMENRFRHKDGSWRWIYWTLTVEEGKIYVIGRNVTAQKRAISRLLESEQQFSMLVNAVTDYALYRLTPEGIISSWNSGAQRAKGYTADEIIGQHFSRFYTPEDQRAGIPAMALRRAAEEGRFETEAWRVRKDGTRFWANVVIDAIHDGGELVGFVKITRDITERREAQNALQRTQEQLAQAQKMEALGQLTGGIAHDFNNMLMVVGGYTQFLKSRLTDGKDRRAVEAIEGAAARAENLTRQLLTFSRRQPLNTSTVNIAECLESFRDVLTATATGNIRLDINVSTRLWPIEVDVNELEVAIINLLVNARDATQPGGTIRISGRNTYVQKYEEPVPIEGDFVVIDVEDSGAGIPPDILPKIFDPFFSTKEASKGTGLGLSQVHGFAQQAGGAVAVSSKIGAGTTVSIYLPRARSTVSVSSADDDSEMQPGRELVLVVEDNTDVQAITANMLEQLGYRTVAAANADQAINILESGQPIDLVLSDIVMPGTLDGLGLARRLKKQFPGMPILLTTGYAKAVVEPFSEFPVLRKPYQMPTLARALREAIDKSAAN